MLESGGECGATNPVVDLARKMTTPSLLDSGITLSDIHNVTNQPEQSNQTSFNMETLLEQMKLVEKLEIDESTVLKKPDSKTPLIGNAQPTIEQEFWTDATRIGVDEELLSFRQSTDLPIYSNDWADEYFSQLPSGENSKLFKFESFDETLLESKEKVEHESVIRNQSISGIEEIQFGSTSRAFSSMPFNVNYRQDVSEQNGNDINLKDLVSDQEERLMQMLLSNNQTNELQASETKQKAEQVETEEIVEEKAKLTEENFFYENQFDDMEFWMKLAEEWQSSTKEDNKTSADTFGEETEKLIELIEPIEKLLDEENRYFYRFVENNPFEKIVENETSGEKEIEKPNFIEEGLKRMNSGDIPAAVLLFEAATKSEPENVDGWRLLGISQAKNENDHKAIAAMKRCLALEPTNLEALMYLATSLTNESMPTEACYALQEWLKQHPKYKHLVEEAVPTQDTSSQIYLGPTPLSKRWSTNNQNDIFMNGFYEAVRKGFINAALLSPDEPDADVQCGLGVLFNVSGEFEKAADCFKTAVSVCHTDHTLWNRLGASLANGGKSEEAMSAYREALLRYPGYIRARYNLSISCIILGAAREAVDHLLTVLNIQDAGPESVRDTINIGREHVTSSSVWSTLRSALMLLGRSDLFESLDERNLSKLNEEFEFKLQTTDNQQQGGL